MMYGSCSCDFLSRVATHRDTDLFEFEKSSTRMTLMLQILTDYHE